MSMPNGAPPNAKNQADQLSDLFLQLSMTLDQIRTTNPDAPQAQSLGTISRQLDELSDQLNAAGIAQTLQNIQPNINNIIQVTKDAQNQVKTIKDIQKVFSIAGAALTLAASIVSGNPATIISAAAGVATAIGGGTGAAPAGAPNASAH
jgi:hypothetical protein